MDELETSEETDVELEVEMGEWAIVVTEGVVILEEGKDATDEDDKEEETMATVGEDGEDVSALLVSSCSCDEEWNDEVAVRRALDVSVGSAEEMEDEEEVEEEVEEEGEEEGMDGEGTCEGKGKASNISEEHGGVVVEGAFTLKSDGLGEDEKQDEGKGKV